MKKTIFIFSALVVSLLVLFQLSTYAVIHNGLRIELIIALIAVVFFSIGVFLHKKSLYLKKDPTSIDTKKISALGISKREYEILIKISEGLSNKEIADCLFVSESTVKTHVSNLFTKLDVKRRTQAIQKAKSFNIIS